MSERLPAVEPEKPFSYETLSDPEVRENIRDRMGRFLRAVHDRKVDTLVFLDRSARPLSWLFRAMWKREYPSEPVPDVKFVNIGTATETHGGQSGILSTAAAWVGSHDEIQWMIVDSIEKERWIAPEKIPSPWRMVIREKRQWIESLRGTFADSFDARRVVMLEELGCSGKTQMTALGLFAEAFPDAKRIEAATFFRSEARNLGGEQADKEQLPWFREEGMAGVLELPDADSLLSGSLSPENVRRIQSAANAQARRIEDDGIPTISAGLESMIRLEEGIRSAFAEDKDLVDALLAMVGRWKAMLLRSEAEGSIGSYDPKAEMAIRTEMFEAMKASGRYGEDWGAIGDVGDFVRDVESEGPSLHMQKIRRIRAAVGPHSDLPSLIARSKRLRREMEELAKGI